MYIAFVVVAYWIVSIGAVYVNKGIMSDHMDHDMDDTNKNNVFLDAPIFLSWFQCVITVLICILAGEVGEWVRKSRSYHPVARVTGSLSPKISEVSAAIGTATANDKNHTELVSLIINPSKDMTDDNANDDDDDGGSAKGAGFARHEHHGSLWAQIPRMDFQECVSKKVLPLSLMFVGMIIFNNLCLKLVHVSYYTVARSLTIVLNVVLSKVILGIPTSSQTLMCLAVVVLGFLMGSKGEPSFSGMGAFIGFGSSCFVSLHAIYIKKMLPVLDDDHWKLTFYNNVNASVLFLPILLIFESGTIYAAATGQSLFSNSSFWMSMLMAGLLGFGTGILTVLQIKATSPLTHNMSGTAKAAVQGVVSFVLWKKKMTLLSILGIFTVLGGSLAYTFVKLGESGRQRRRFVTMASHNSGEDLIEMTSGSHLKG